jgi:hypothetical protein
VSATSSSVAELSTAYSTTTIPQPGGGFITSTEYTAVPTAATSATPSTVQSSGAEKAMVNGIYGLVWVGLLAAVGAVLQ